MRSGVDSALARLVLALPTVTRPPVLAYHHVGEPGERPDVWLTMRPEQFAAQMAWLADHGVRGVNVSTWLDGQSRGPSVVLTFDDAYDDLCEHVFPVLRCHGFGATVFVVTGVLGATNRWDEAIDRTSYRIMGADDVRTWSRQGIEFGAHTRTHPKLTDLTADQLRDEIVGSRDDLAVLLDAPPRAFAYPYGLAGAAARRIVAQTFDVAFATREGPNRPGTDRMQLRRSGALAVDSATDLALRIRVGWTPRHRVRQRVRSHIGRARRRALGRG